MFRPSSFPPLTPVIKNLLIINGLIFLAQLTFENKFPVNELFAQHHFLSKSFRPHQIITAMFMHGSWGHLLGNMFGLYLFGAKLEMVWGSKRFLSYYLICGIGAGIISGLATLIETYPAMADIHLLMEQPTVSNFNMLFSKYNVEHIFENAQQVYDNLNANPSSVTTTDIILDSAFKLKDYFTGGSLIGASGAIFGLLAGAAYLFPDDILYVELFIPLKIKWAALIYAGVELYLAIRNAPGDQVAHVAHLGGALVGFLILFFSYRRGNRRKLF